MRVPGLVRTSHDVLLNPMLDGPMHGVTCPSDAIPRRVSCCDCDCDCVRCAVCGVRCAVTLSPKHCPDCTRVCCPLIPPAHPPLPKITGRFCLFVGQILLASVTRTDMANLKRAVTSTLFCTISHVFLTSSSALPRSHARRGTCSQCPCSFDADWCLQSDVVTILINFVTSSGSIREEFLKGTATLPSFLGTCSQLDALPRAPHAMLYLVPMLVGC